MLRYVTLVAAVVGISAVQLIVKARFNAEHGAIPADARIGRYILGLLSDPMMWVAGVLLVSSALLYYFSLSRLPASVAIAVAALVYPLIVGGSALFLGEAVAGRQIAGCLLIMVGVYLTAGPAAVTSG